MGTNIKEEIASRPINPELKKMARWCNRKWLFKSCSYEEYNDKTRKWEKVKK